jgi:hypothetical protein
MECTLGRRLELKHVFAKSFRTQLAVSCGVGVSASQSARSEVGEQGKEAKA